MTLSFRMYWGMNYKCLVSTIHMYYMYLSCIEHFATAGFYRFIGQFCRLEKGTILHASLSKTYWYCINKFQHAKLCSFQNLNLGFVFKYS